MSNFTPHKNRRLNTLLKEYKPSTILHTETNVWLWQFTEINVNKAEQWINEAVDKWAEYYEELKYSSDAGKYVYDYPYHWDPDNWKDIRTRSREAISNILFKCRYEYSDYSDEWNEIFVDLLRKSVQDWLNGYRKRYKYKRVKLF